MGINKILICLIFIQTKLLIYMSDKHATRFVLYALLGLILTTAGIICLVYGSATKASNDWVFWAVVSAICVNAGLLLLGKSIVHKIKADLAQRRRQHH